MSGPPYDDDNDDDAEDDADGADEVVARPRTLGEWFLRGDKRLAVAGMSVFIGALLATDWLSGWTHVAYNTAPPGIRHLFWVAGAGFLFGLFFQPNKFRSGRSPLGFVRLKGWPDYTFFAAAVAASFAACAAVGRLT